MKQTKKSNVIHLHSVTDNSRYSFEFQLKHGEHVLRIKERYHKIMDQTKYKKVL